MTELSTKKNPDLAIGADCQLFKNIFLLRNLEVRWPKNLKKAFFILKLGPLEFLEASDRTIVR